MLDFKLTQHRPKAQAHVDAEQEDQVYDLIILGGGAAGLTSAIYASRAALKTLVLVGPIPGGQVSITDMVENFPGFPEGISGVELVQRVQSQAERFGAQIVMESVTGVDFSTSPFAVRTQSQTYQGRTVIIATGAVPRRLEVPGEAKFFGRGVSTCATCDGFFYKDKRVVVAGGGDSAIDEGLFLTRFAREVVVVHRRDQLRAAKIYQERAFANPKMRFVWDSVVEEVLGEQTVTGVRLRNVKTGDTSVIEADGLFVYIGMRPGTKLFAGQVELDDLGYIVTDRRQRTSVPGVFAAGDVQNPDFHQIVVAAGSGAMAAIEAGRFLAEQSQPSNSTGTVQVTGNVERQEEHLVKQLEHLATVTKALTQEVEHLQRWHPLAGSLRLVLWRNFLRGIAGGLGQTVGATVILALLVWLVGRLQVVPVLGVWIARILEEIQVAQQGF